MDYISSESTIVNMMEFMDPFSSAEFRRSEKRMKSIMDSVTYWGSPEKKILYTTSLTKDGSVYRVRQLLTFLSTLFTTQLCVKGV